MLEPGACTGIRPGGGGERRIPPYPVQEQEQRGSLTRTLVKQVNTQKKLLML